MREIGCRKLVSWILYASGLTSALRQVVSGLPWMLEQVEEFDWTISNEK